MSDLVEKIRAAIDEDERIARAAIEANPAPWRPGSKVSPYDDQDVVDAKGERLALCPDCPAGGALAPSTAMHVSRHDPARVLRQVKSRRTILDEHQLTVSKHEQLPYDPVSGERVPDSWDVECARCGWCSSDPASGCPTVLALAEDYEIEVED